ncbi:hypothetical protein GF323_02065 [Candidatus Woesearchaeota archaeon]|nr:hypothetical protein [Candidatus Woesearchaeota archaeon]
MYTRVIKSKLKQDYFGWINDNGYSISSPKHRGYYAEMVFRGHCIENGITSIKINPHFSVLEQIPAYFLKKIQQKELKKLGKIGLDFFCFGRKGGYFAALKMGTGNLNQSQRKLIPEMEKNRVFLFRVFEDGDIFIKRLN